jgi:4-hydroxy-2-oxoglutarate aldolase
MDLAGVYPALTTPFAADGSVSLGDMKYNIERYNSTGLAGYVVLGSTGESVLLSRAEGDAVLATVKETAGQGKRLIAGTGAESTAETIERTKRAADLGYHLALVKTPYYYKPAYKPELLIAHYRRVADASPIPILLYSVPIFTGVTLEASEVAALAQHPNIVGIKDSSGHVMRVAEMVADTPSDFQILTRFWRWLPRYLKSAWRCSSLSVAARSKKPATCRRSC